MLPECGRRRPYQITHFPANTPNMIRPFSYPLLQQKPFIGYTFLPEDIYPINNSTSILNNTEYTHRKFTLIQNPITGNPMNSFCCNTILYQCYSHETNDIRAHANDKIKLDTLCTVSVTQYVITQQIPVQRYCFIHLQAKVPIIHLIQELARFIGQYYVFSSSRQYWTGTDRHVPATGPV